MTCGMEAALAMVAAALEETGFHAGGALAAEARLDEDLGVDSLDFVAVVQAIEERLGEVIEDEALAGVRSVGDLAARVAEAMARPAA